MRSPTVKDVPRLHRSYTRWWVVLIPAAIVSHLAGAPDWVLAVFLVVGAVVEIVAAFVRPKGGDTLSEHVWFLVRAKPALWPLSLGLAVWLVWASVRLIPSLQAAEEATLAWTGGVDPGLGALVLGVLVWALLHFALLGRWG